MKASSLMVWTHFPKLYFQIAFRGGKKDITELHQDSKTQDLLIQLAAVRLLHDLKTAKLAGI